MLGRRRIRGAKENMEQIEFETAYTTDQLIKKLGMHIHNDSLLEVTSFVNKPFSGYINHSGFRLTERRSPFFMKGFKRLSIIGKIDDIGNTRKIGINISISWINQILIYTFMLIGYLQLLPSLVSMKSKIILTVFMISVSIITSIMSIKKNKNDYKEIKEKLIRYIIE